MAAGGDDLFLDHLAQVRAVRLRVGVRGRQRGRHHANVFAAARALTGTGEHPHLDRVDAVRAQRLAILAETAKEPCREFLQRRIGDRHQQHVGAQERDARAVEQRVHVLAVFLDAAGTATASAGSSTR